MHCYICFRDVISIHRDSMFSPLPLLQVSIFYFNLACFIIILVLLLHF